MILYNAKFFIFNAPNKVLGSELNWKRLVETSFKIIAVMFAVSALISIAFYYQLHSTLRTDPTYVQIRGYFTLTGVSSLLLFFATLLGVAYVMVIWAKRTLDKGILRLHEEQKLEQALIDDAP